MKKYLLAVFITLILTIVLASQIDLRQILKIVTNTQVKYIIMAGLCYFLQYLGRAIRFSFLLREARPGFQNTFDIVCVHNFLNHILPARIGESSYLVLMNRCCNVKMMYCIASLFSARIMDLLCICAIFLFSLTFMYGREGGLATRSAYMFIIPVLIAVLLFVILMFLGKIVKSFCEFVAYLFNRLSQGAKIAHYFTEKATDLQNHLALVNRLDIVIKAGTATIVIWLCNIAMFSILMKGFGHPMRFLEIALGSTGAALANVLPINGFGSFGTLEAGWTIAFMFVGLSKDVAIATGFGIHIIAFAYAAFFAAIGYSWLWIKFLNR